MLKRTSRQWLVISCLAALTTACGGGGSGGSNSSASPSSSPSSSPSASPTPSPIPPSAKHNVRLSWAAPSTRADGTALPASSLTGYRLFYMRDGSDPSDDAVVPVNGGNVTSTLISLNAAGAYTFAITAVDSSGNESTLSMPAMITID